MKKPILCLTIRQPWATLIILGAKHWETRDWGTPYRGPLIIHAAKALDEDQVGWCLDPAFRKVLSAGGYPTPYDLPRGKAIGISDLADCVATDEQRAQVTAQELHFGDWSDGRKVWRLDNVRAFVKPVPIQGKLSLWPWPANLPLPEVRKP